MIPSRLERVRSAVSVLAVLSAVACKEEPAALPKESSGDAGAAKVSKVDKALEEAVAAVAGGAAPLSSAGPPPTGVFAPGAADREFPSGALPKLSLGGKGEGPTVTFGAPQRKRVDGVVQVSVQLGPRSALPTVELSCTAELARASAEKGADEKSAAEMGSASPVEVVVRITAAKLSAEQPGELPPGLAKEIAKIKGSRLTYLADASGGGRLQGIELAPGVDESLAQIVRSGADGLAVEFLPFPAEPVGAGAFWMVTSRDSFAGLDVVTYRMLKLEKVEGDRAVVSVNTRRYTAGGHLAFQGLPPHRVDEFAGPTQGQLSVSIRDPAVLDGQLNDVIQAGLSSTEAPSAQQPPGQKMGVEFRVRTRVSMNRP